MPVHFLDLASAVEKLRWAEKEWRELDKEMEGVGAMAGEAGAQESQPDEDSEEPHSERVLEPADVRH